MAHDSSRIVQISVGMELTFQEALTSLRGAIYKCACLLGVGDVSNRSWDYTSQVGNKSSSKAYEEENKTLCPQQKSCNVRRSAEVIRCRIH